MVLKDSVIKSIPIFDEFAQEYDAWFDMYKFAYESEIMALSRFIPKKGKGLEIGAGTGRFSVPFRIRYGVEPAKSMARIARKRGITIYEAVAEILPFDNKSFDFILIVATICFLQNPLQSFQEVRRVLKPGGSIIIGMIDTNSPLGMEYVSEKNKSKFYQHAHFYSVEQILLLMRESGFSQIRICQTIFINPKELNAIEPVKDGYGGGIFVVISARRGNRR